jgi:hypothetical protein
MITHFGKDHLSIPHDFRVEMGVRSVVLDRKMKGMNVNPIDEDRVDAIHEEALEDSMVPGWLCHERLARFSDPTSNLAEDSQLTEMDRSILSALNGEPFASVPDIAGLTSRPRRTVHLHHTHSLRFRVCHLLWIAHFMTEGNKARVTQIRRHR